MAAMLEMAMKRAGDGGLDLPVAVLTGAAAAMVAFLVPVSMLEGVSLASGAAALLPMAAPPLGFTAQMAFAAVAAVAGFTIGLTVMRLLDRASSWFDPAPAVETDEDELPAPRMRRRDSHPDAPARRPLSALRDLGVPGEPVRMAKRRLPIDEPEPEPFAPAPVEAANLPEIEAAPPPVPEFAPEPPVLAVSAPERFAEVAHVPPLPEPSFAPPPVPRRADESIAELVARLERALDRRQAAPAPERAPAPQPSAPFPIDDRLRSALENLKRFAPQAG